MPPMDGGGRLAWEEFLDLETAWDALVLSGPAPVPFMIHGWLRAWWRHFGEAQRFVAPAVREGGRLRAAVPLAVRRVGRGFGPHVAEIVGTGPVPTRGMGLADRVCLLCRDGDLAAEAALDEALAGLGGECDLLHLKGIDSGARAARLLAGPGARELPRSASPYLPLPPTWERYMGSRSGNFRRHLRKYWRALEQEGGPRVRRMGPHDDLGPWLEAVRSVEGSSWKARRGTDLFRHPRLRAFLEEVLRTLAPAGRIDLHVLDLAGVPIAYEWCFDVGGRVFSYNSAFREEHARLSPGVVLTAAVIESAIARGRVEYDLLRGDEGYKAQWATAARREHEWLVPLGGPRSHLLARAYAWRNRLKNVPALVELDDRLSGTINRFRG